MRRWVAVMLAGASVAATLALGVSTASASARYTCTRKAAGHTATVTVRTDRAEDSLEAHGFTCTGD
jgi:hypothetical protein